MKNIAFKKMAWKFEVQTLSKWLLKWSMWDVTKEKFYFSLHAGKS